MYNIILPKIEYKKFSQTRDTLQLYAQLLSAFKSNFMPHQKNWEEYSLKIYANGFSTGPIPIETANGIKAIGININLSEKKLELLSGENHDSIDLHQNNIASFTRLFLEKLIKYGIKDFQPEEKFFSNEPLNYDDEEISKIWDLLRQFYFIFLKFKGSTLYETSSINFWPHHFDLALLIFSGKIIEGKEPQNWDNSREQMNFGISTGDQGNAQPYFYITAYPFNDKLFDFKLPEYAYWHTEGWNGVVIKYEEMLKNSSLNSSFKDFLVNFLNYNFK